MKTYIARLLAVAGLVAAYRRAGVYFLRVVVDGDVMITKKIIVK